MAADLRAGPHDALRRAGIDLIPTVADAYTAKLAGLAGFKTTLMGAQAVAQMLLGSDDPALVTLTEMEFMLARASAAADVAIIADAGTGFGNAVNVVHATRGLENTGAAGMLLDDRIPPAQRRGADDAQLVSPEEMTGKLRAALDTRRSDRFRIIVASHAVDSDLRERAARYAQAGADMLVLDAKRLASVSDMKSSCRLAVSGDPSQGALGGASVPEGVAAAFIGPLLLQASTLAMQRFLDDFRARGNDADLQLVRDLEGSPMEDWYQFTGFEDIRALEERYLPAEEVARRYSASQAHGYYEPAKKGGA